MSDIIKELYTERFFADRPLTEEYQALAKKDSEIWAKVKPILGRALMDQIQSSQSDLCYQTNYEWFREGFCLGASLMLELL